MLTDGRGAGRRATVALAMALACAACGGTSRPRPAGDPLASLPTEIASRLPTGFEVVAGESPADGYSRWLLRAPGSSWIKSPAKADGHPHRLPSRILVDLFAAMVPGVETGTPQQTMGRFTHWAVAGGSEVQIREIVTDRGWFASVEMFNPEAAARPPS